MTVTVSNAEGVKQYNIPNNIKKLIILFLLFLTIVISGLLFSVKTLNDTLVRLEENINTERIVEKPKDNISYLAKNDVRYEVEYSEKIPAYELSMFEDDTLEEEALKEEILAAEALSLLKLKQEKEALVKIEQEKKDALAKIEKEKKDEARRVLSEIKEQDALVKAEKLLEQELAEANAKAEKFAKIRFDTAMLINTEQKKNDKLAELEKIKREKKIKLAKAKLVKKIKLAKAKLAQKKKEKLARAQKKKEALAKLAKKKKLKLAKLVKAKQKKKALAKLAKKKKLKNVKIAKNNTYATYKLFQKNVNLQKSFEIYQNNLLLAKANGKNTKLTVDISDQRVKLYVNNEIALSSPCTTGAKRKFEPNTKIYRDKRTPKGTFKITEKIADKRSTIFGKFYRNGKVVYKGDRRKYKGPKAKYIGASLKNWMRLTSGGIGLHASKYVKRYPGTNGCIRLPYRVSKMIFKNVRKGTKVSIIN